MNVSLISWRLVLVALIACLPSVSAAHGKLIRAQPPADSEIAQLPETIRLSFSERIESRFSRVTVHRAIREAESWRSQRPGNVLTQAWRKAPR